MRDWAETSYSDVDDRVHFGVLFLCSFEEMHFANVEATSTVDYGTDKQYA